MPNPVALFLLSGFASLARPDAPFRMVRRGQWNSKTSGDNPGPE